MTTSSYLTAHNQDNNDVALSRHSNSFDYNLGDKTELYLIKQFYNQAEADSLFDKLLTDINWQKESIVIFNKRIEVPRLMCWYGDPVACYRYSGVDHKPNPWTHQLLEIKTQIEAQCQANFNSVLANLYCDGRDSMGCHSDNEKELGTNPVIASLSLGAERIFRMHHKKSKRSLTIPLSHGDLLIMAGTCQHHWLHSVPKTKAFKTPRINLTFRKIIPV
jgi:alkylated DNA repair dioxygenase AlkB